MRQKKTRSRHAMTVNLINPRVIWGLGCYLTRGKLGCWVYRWNEHICSDTFSRIFLKPHVSVAVVFMYVQFVWCVIHWLGICVCGWQQRIWSGTVKGIRDQNHHLELIAKGHKRKANDSDNHLKAMKIVSPWWPRIKLRFAKTFHLGSYIEEVAYKRHTFLM